MNPWKYTVAMSTLVFDRSASDANTMLDDAVLDLLSANRFEYIELAFDQIKLPWSNPPFIEGLQKRLEKHSIRTISLHAPITEPPFFASLNEQKRRAVTAHLKEYLRATRPLQPEILVVHPGPLSGYHGTLQRLLTALRESLMAMLDAAKAYETKIAVESLSYPDHPQFLADVFDDLPEGRLGICMDVGHINTCTGLQRRWDFPHPSFSQIIEGYGERLISIHAHDNTAKRETDEHLPPGHGDVPFPEVLAALEKIDYQGPFVFECLPLGTAEATLTQCRQWADRYLRRDADVRAQTRADGRG